MMLVLQAKPDAWVFYYGKDGERKREWFNMEYSLLEMYLRRKILTRRWKTFQSVVR